MIHTTNFSNHYNYDNYTLPAVVAGILYTPLLRISTVPMWNLS